MNAITGDFGAVGAFGLREYDSSVMTSFSTNAAVVLVTGPSGAGRSTAIKAFEDLGYETIDNFPLALLPSLIGGPSLGRPIVLGIAARTRDFSIAAVLGALETIAESGIYEPSLVFLECQTETLLRRYSETRSRHPMAPDDTPLRGIEIEMQLLARLRDRADVLIDTTPLTPHDLKAEISTLFGAADSAVLAVSVQSFSYKRGIPRGVDMVIDCRFLRNPHWDAVLRPKSGTDADVVAYVAADQRFAAFFKGLHEMVGLLLPAYREEGKAHFSIGLGCTGGQHRSVAVAEGLTKALARDGWQVSIRHREMERRGGA
jgi:UPF0042 nucleotide-binding protein